MSTLGKKILVIPDSHARPGVSNRRFKALSNFIADKRPDIVVNIGDMADMPSLCHHDKGQKQAEGRRYEADIASVQDALKQMFSAKGSEKPKHYITLGNHENRITRAGNLDPTLDGKLSIRDLRYEEAGIRVVPFLKPLVLEDICFQHYFTSGVLGKPIGGVNHARTLVLKNYQSSVCGHSHGRDYWEDTKADGKKVFGLVVGCYDEPGSIHEYTTEQRRWWNGLCMIHEAKNGQGEPAFYSTDYVLRKFL